ncbi:predicted protein [Naegleria gruberi]|uniref:Predicted protein n=1 Tax=Naegleria gruberi TaxID=5762 RepID=D2W4F2_NAEGR|nr:uncharacterized protein NAEGRDRAFT_76283 [Naegleria gruberi]EFC36053.1 predicted protein [Naegleria gruberi]|eukprot:XP_002668797.1 predicted protein [Naegleria gruberi strain NEG-M]
MNNSQQQLFDTTNITTATPNAPNTPTITNVHESSSKKRKAKSKAYEIVDSTTITATTPKSKKRKTKASNDSIPNTSSSSPNDSASLGNSSTITTTTATQSPKRSRKLNLGLQSNDFKTLIEFNRFLSELNEQEDMKQSIEAILPRFKFDFLKALIVSCRKITPKYLTNYRSHQTKYQTLLQIISVKSETLNLIKLITNENDNNICNNNNNTIKSVVNNFEMDNYNDIVNNTKQTTNDVPTISQSNEGIVLDWHSYCDITLDLIQSTYLPFSTTTTNNILNNTNEFNTVNNNNIEINNTNTNNNNNNNTNTVNNNVIDDSFSFSDFLDCSSEIVPSNERNNEELINDLMKQLNEKNQQIEQLNRMFQLQETYNQNLLNLIQTFKNNLYEFDQINNNNNNFI